MADQTPVAKESGLRLSRAAAARIRDLIKEEGNSALKLRVHISGGGCSGFQYGFGLEEEVKKGDEVIQQNGVTVIVDPMSLAYLEGAEVDYAEDIRGERFIIRNPNAVTTCGCGSSFTA